MDAFEKKIQSLIDYANETTGAGDTLLGDAVKTLCDGYGGGEPVDPNYEVIPSIRTEGNAWLDTELTGGSSSAYELTFGCFTYQNAWAQMFSGRKDYPIYTAKMYFNGNRLVVASDGGDASLFDTWDVRNERHRILVSDSQLWQNGLLLGAASTNGWPDCGFWLGNSSTEPTLTAKAEFVSLKMWKDGVLVRDYVPRRRVSDGKIGMLDLCGSICSVTGTPFYVSIGPEDFTVGLI